MEFKFSYSKAYDFVLHILAHMKVENASDLYSRDYIEKIAQAKGSEYDLTGSAAHLAPYYNAHFDRLEILNFIPFSCQDFPALKNALSGYKGFTEEDRTHFITPLLTLMDHEYAFYSDYWEKQFFTYDRAKAEEEILRKFQPYRRVLDHFQKESAIAMLSLSLTRNGRGLGNPGAFIAAAPCPLTQKDCKNTVFTLLHEYTHQFTDSLVAQTISMSDGSHDLSEQIVLLFDYYIIRAQNETDIAPYFAWIAKNGGYDVFGESEFRELTQLPDALHRTLISLLREVTS